jgi:thiamine-phosphate pyrophosphorylase
VRGLYPIVDVETCSAHRVHPLAFASAVLAVRPAALQLRAKELSARETLTLLRAMRPLCLRAGVPLVCNDRADLAALAGADMVHVGQDDAPIELVRRLSPELRVGVSTHTLAQLVRALAAQPDYVAFGPVYPTQSKKDPDALVGLSGLRGAAALVVERAMQTGRPAPPLVAIGGITIERAREVAAIVSVGAVIAALVGSEKGAACAREARIRAATLHAALARAAVDLVGGEVRV